MGVSLSWIASEETTCPKRIYNNKMGNSHAKENIFRDEDIAFMVDNSPLTREDVEEMYDSFYEKYPDGMITREGFRRLLEKTHPDEDMNKLQGFAFRCFDSDGDGTIDFRELMTFFYMLATENDEDIMRMIFRIYDVNSNGSISRQEMDKIVKVLFRLGSFNSEKGIFEDEDAEEALSDMAFDEMDTDDDGNVTEYESMKAIANEEKASSLISIKLLDLVGELVDNSD